MRNLLIFSVSVLWPVCVADAGGDPRAYSVERRAVGGAEFLVATPMGYRVGDGAALVVCLHGTNTDARDILSLWLSLDRPYPMLFVAVQSSGRGWRDSDADRVLGAIDWVKREKTFDASRVLLTGHSAGGAMTFHLVYERGFPATAAATTANYIPPSVSAEEIRARSDLPVYYAVGTRDINRDRMRAGIILLRSNGTRVTVERPSIGHVLDSATTQKAMDFFVRQNSLRIDRLLSSVKAHVRADRPGVGLALLELVLDSERYHGAGDVAKVRRLRAEIETSAEPAIAEADAMARRGDVRAAVNLLYQLELRFSGGRLARRLAARRGALSAKLPADSPDRDTAKRRAEARRLFELALRLTRERKFGQAREKCRILLASYPGTKSAAAARRLGQQLDLHLAP